MPVQTVSFKIDDSMQTNTIVMPPPSRKYTPEQAARMITRVYRRLIMFQRLYVYRKLNGVLFSRKYIINPMTGAFEIMTMHMISTLVDKQCRHLRFTIFDYVTKKISYSGLYEALDGVT